MSFINNLLSLYVKNAALAYSWIVVSFDAWFYGLESVKLITSWDQINPAMKSILFILYPTYFGYSSASIISSYKETGIFPISSRGKYHIMMILFFIFGSYMGRKAGTAARIQT